MTDPYKVLQVAQSATDEEIKDAYRKLAKKYHPDQYSDSPLKDLADEKMKEINDAYDTITSRRKGGRAGMAGGGYGSSYAGGYNPVNGGGSESGGSGFRDVRSYISSGRIAEAEQILNGVPQDRRDAEWYFLKGSVLYRRGWVEEAKEHFTRACQIDPRNPEYAAALNQVMNRGQGVYGGYNPNMNVGNQCGPLDLCASLMCTSCCCNCMGGGC